MKTLIYCNLSKPYLYQSEYNLNYYLKKYKMEAIEPELRPQLLNGKVVAQFDFDRWEKIEQSMLDNLNGSASVPEEWCLTWEELFDYTKFKDFYIYHIDNLQVFDEPVDVLDLTPVPDKNTIVNGVINKVRGKQYVYYKGEKCLLLPIKSKWVYKILNGEKTVEIRKTLPKEVR